MDRTRSNGTVTLFVGGLRSITGESDVVRIVKEASGFTPLAVKLIFDQKTSTIKCFCFITLASQGEANKVKSCLVRHGYKVGDAHEDGSHRASINLLLSLRTNPTARLSRSAKAADLGPPFARYLVNSFKLVVAKLETCLSYHQQLLSAAVPPPGVISQEAGQVGKRLGSPLYELVTLVRTTYDLLECLIHGSDSSPLSNYNERWMLAEPPVDAPFIDSSHLRRCANALAGTVWSEDGSRTIGRKSLTSLLESGGWRVVAGPVTIPIYIFDVDDSRDHMSAAIPLVVIPFETSYLQPRRSLLPRQIAQPHPVYYSVNPERAERARFAFGEWNKYRI